MLRNAVTIALGIYLGMLLERVASKLYAIIAQSL